MAQEVGHHGTFQISPIDRLGRKIETSVLCAAEEIAHRAIQYAEKLLCDPALATDLLEESAATVSRAIEARKLAADGPVRNLHAYLFRTFLRRLNKIKRREVGLSSTAKGRSTTDHRWADWRRSFELKLLVDEFLARCDPITRDMFYRRVQGFSWKEIAAVYGISGHAAEARFGQMLQRVRKRLNME